MRQPVETTFPGNPAPSNSTATACAPAPSPTARRNAAPSTARWSCIGGEPPACTPWTELGDAPLDAQLKALAMPDRRRWSSAPAPAPPPTPPRARGA
ncbi:MAG: hypothetical protein R3F11_21465 [Verrucomicrobiales bacterium]